jgi:membrane-bound ClpP family serine protease
MARRKVVEGLRRWASSYTITPFGVVILVILAAAALVVLFGPRSAQTPALIVGLLILFGLLASGLSGDSRTGGRL